MKRTPLSLAVFLLFSLAPLSSFSQPAVTGNQYLAFTQELKIFYMKAFWEGWTTYQFAYDGIAEKGKWFAASKMTHGQSADIMTKYLEENPEIRHNELCFLIFRVFLDLHVKELSQKEDIEGLKRLKKDIIEGSP